MQNKLRMFLYGFLTILFVISQFGISFFLGDIINTLSIYNNILFIKRCYWIAILLILLFITNIGKRNIIESIKYTDLSSKKSIITEKIFAMEPYALIEKENSFYTNLLQNDFNKYEQLYLGGLWNITEKVLMILICIFILIVADVKILMAAIIMIGLVCCVPYIFDKLIQKLTSNYSDNMKILMDDLHNYLNNANQLQYFGTLNHAEKRFHKQLLSTTISKQNLYFLLILQNNLSLILSMILTIGIMIYATYLKQTELITISFSSLSISFISGLLSENVLEFIDSYNKFKSGKVFKKNIDVFLKMDIKKATNEISRIHSITFNNVAIEKGDKILLSNVNITFAENKKYLIIGKSGSGKSSFINTLLFLNAYLGEIYMNGINMQTINKNSIFSNISYINGNGKVFDGTITENITMFNNKFDEPTLFKICDLLELKNINKQITENTISGGERQKILIARSLYKNSSVFIIDEATSELDMRMQYKIEEYFLDMQNKMIINVSHKIPGSLIKNYDFIYKIEDGCICNFLPDYKRYINV